MTLMGILWLKMFSSENENVTEQNFLIEIYQSQLYFYLKKVFHFMEEFVSRKRDQYSPHPKHHWNRQIPATGQTEQYLKADTHGEANGLGCGSTVCARIYPRLFCRTEEKGLTRKHTPNT